MKNGKFCDKSKSKERCPKHPLEKYKPHLTDPELCEKIIDKLIHMTPDETSIECPCGTILKRWNFAHHCKFPKHITWTKTMPELKTIKQWGANTAQFIAISEYYRSKINGHNACDQDQLTSLNKSN